MGPAQGGDLVLQSEIGAAGPPAAEVGQVQEPEGSQAVVGGHDHRPGLPGQRLPVGGGGAAEPASKPPP
jgi:hypothetical protein